MFLNLRRLMSQKFPLIFPENTEQVRILVHDEILKVAPQDLENILLEWSKNNLSSMNRDQLIQFHNEVLSQEPSHLQDIITGKVKNPGGAYLTELTNFVKEKIDPEKTTK